MSGKWGYSAKVGLLQEGGPLPGNETGLLSNTQKWIVRGDTCVMKQEILLGKGTWVESSRMRETRRIALPVARTVLGLMLMRLVSGLSLANHSDSESFLAVHALFSQDGCQREGFWEVCRHAMLPFDFSWTPLVDGGLLVLCCLPGPHANGYYGAWPRWMVSVC